MHFHGIVVFNPVNYRKFPFHLCRQPVDTTAVPKIKAQFTILPLCNLSFQCYYIKSGS